MLPETITHIAHLARLALSEQETTNLAGDLNKIFQLIDSMNELNTDNITPMAHPLDAKQRLRADKVTESNQREQFLAIAPDAQQGLFIVPEVIE